MMRKTWIAASAAALVLAGVLSACGKKEPAAQMTRAAGQEMTQAVLETGMEVETGDSSAGKGKDAEKGKYRKLTAEDAKARMDSGDDIVILDVRTEEEYKEKHIPGAFLIPNENIGTDPLELLPDLEKEILVYCRSGNRSAQAAKKLIEAGYQNVYDFGGIKDWPYETESGERKAENAGESQVKPGGTDSTEAAEEQSAAEGDADASQGIFGTFTSHTLDGEEITEEVFTKADLTMVNIWGTFCGPCIGEMPDLGELSREYADKGVQIVGIVSDITDPEDAAAHDIVSQTKADYTHIVLSEDLYNNYLGLVTVVPTTVFVDKNGKQVGQTYAGSKSKNRWKGIIDDALEKVQ